MPCPCSAEVLQVCGEHSAVELLRLFSCVSVDKMEAKEEA